MAYVTVDVSLGTIDLYTVDTAGPGPLAGAGNGPTTFGRANYPGLVVRGWDTNLGGGGFIFARASAAVAAGQTCELGVTVTNGRYDASAAPWAGTANSGKPLGVALVALAQNQFGWFQVEGIAIATVSGAPVAGNPAYWQAAGTVSPTVIASKHMLNTVFVSAPGVTIGTGAGAVTLSGTQALLLLNQPFAQGAIT